MIYVRLDYGYQFKSYVGEASEYIARYAVSAMACHIARHPISAANASNLFGFARKETFSVFWHTSKSNTARN